MRLLSFQEGAGCPFPAMRIVWTVARAEAEESLPPAVSLSQSERSQLAKNAIPPAPSGGSKGPLLLGATDVLPLQPSTSEGLEGLWKDAFLDTPSNSDIMQIFSGPYPDLVEDHKLHGDSVENGGNDTG